MRHMAQRLYYIYYINIFIYVFIRAIMAVCGKFSRNLIDRRQRTGFWKNKVETLVKYNGINAFSNNEHDLNDDKKITVFQVL